MPSFKTLPWLPMAFGMANNPLSECLEIIRFEHLTYLFMEPPFLLITSQLCLRAPAIPISFPTLATQCSLFIPSSNQKILLPFKTHSNETSSRTFSVTYSYIIHTLCQLWLLQLFIRDDSRAFAARWLLSLFSCTCSLPPR